MTDYTPANINSFNGTLQSGESLNGFNGNKNAIFSYGSNNNPVITVTGDNVKIKNLVVYPNTGNIHATAIKINPGVVNCKIENVLLSPKEVRDPVTKVLLELIQFDKGIEINPMASNITNSGHLLSHIQMGQGGHEAVRTGIKLCGPGYFKNISIVDVGMTLANDSSANCGIEIGTGNTLNTSCIVANTWFRSNAINAGGLYIDGTMNNSFIKFTTERESTGTSNGYGIKLGSNASIATATSNNGNLIYHYKMGSLYTPLINPSNKSTNCITWLG
jgi:hypothetical protein